MWSWLPPWTCQSQDCQCSTGHRLVGGRTFAPEGRHSQLLSLPVVSASSFLWALLHPFYLTHMSLCLTKLFLPFKGHSKTSPVGKFSWCPQSLSSPCEFLLSQAAWCHSVFSRRGTLSPERAMVVAHSLVCPFLFSAQNADSGMRLNWSEPYWWVALQATLFPVFKLKLRGAR
jgi:hypothetical protein